MSDALIFVLTTLAIASQFGDTYTTQIGLAHGATEVNPVGKWLLSKLPIQAIYPIKCAVLPLGALMLANLGGTVPMVIVESIIAAGGVFACVYNYLTLRKANISL